MSCQNECCATTGPYAIMYPAREYVMTLQLVNQPSQTTSLYVFLLSGFLPLDAKCLIGFV